MAKLDYFTAGIESLEMSLEHLEENTDRDLRATILLGFHGVTALLKSVAVTHGISVRKGSHSIEFPELVGALKAEGWLSKGDGKTLHVLANVRNPLEHEEVEYDRLQFEAALHGALPILERIVREQGRVDLQEVLSSDAWETLMGINTFFEHRLVELRAVVEEVLAREVGVGKDRLETAAQAGYCENCGSEGLPWQGDDHEEVRCRLCGEVSIVTACNWCSGSVAINEGEEWPYYHDECLQMYLSRE